MSLPRARQRERLRCVRKKKDEKNLSATTHATPTPPPASPDIIFSGGKHKPSAAFNIIYTLHASIILYIILYYYIVYTPRVPYCRVSCVWMGGRACVSARARGKTEKLSEILPAPRRYRVSGGRTRQRGWKNRRKTVFFFYVNRKTRLITIIKIIIYIYIYTHVT